MSGRAILIGVALLPLNARWMIQVEHIRYSDSPTIQALVLATLRVRFTWWPFYPVGYLVVGSFGMLRLWFPVFATWLAKSAILRYGGLEHTPQGRPVRHWPGARRVQRGVPAHSG